jgi:hypothetical protein
MRLDSAQDLKQRLLDTVVGPFTARANRVRDAGADAIADAMAVRDVDRTGTVFGIGARPFRTLPRIQRSIALGIAPHARGYRLAVRLQRPAFYRSPIVDHFRQAANGEVDVRVVGRIDKRARPWYQRDTRPLLIGASIAHVRVTAGTIGGFVSRGGATFILSNNHVLANENAGAVGDRVLQRAPFDGGRHPDATVGRLSHVVRLRRTGINVIDAALASTDDRIAHDATRLRELVNGKDRALAGVGPALVDEATTVYKVGRTTGATRGRVTAFDLDNLVVNYDLGNLRFDGQIEIEGTGQTPFSDGGDSGSLIVDADMRAVALLFAGSETGGRNNLGLTFANPIHRVLAGVKAALLF